MSLPEYDTLNDALQRCEIAADAAECHGALSGLMSTSGDVGAARWLSATLPEVAKAIAGGDALAVELQSHLHALYNDAVEKLLSGDLGYTLLLPDDEQEMETRVTALGHWCQGFLLGLQVSGVDIRQDLSPDLSEVVQDMTEISQISEVELQNDEEEEQAYTELVEYLRVGVMLFCDEFLVLPGQEDEDPTMH